MTPAWVDKAACRGVDDEVFFAQSNTQLQRARWYCNRCPVRQQCLDDVMRSEEGLARPSRHGFRGGLTPRGRVRLAAELRRTNSTA